jgi:hypothetical protein
MFDGGYLCHLFLRRRDFSRRCVSAGKCLNGRKPSWIPLRGARYLNLTLLALTIGCGLMEQFE